MTIFSRRREPPEPQKNYRKHAPYVREDFSECCAYCLLHEILAGGRDNFELDHFQPRSKFCDVALVDNFYNLYYSCHVCNHYKSNSWPSEDLVSRGYRFVDPCMEGFSRHFTPEKGGRWKAISRAGRYTEARLRLNRGHLVEVRALINEIAALQGASIDWNIPTKSQFASLMPQFMMHRSG